MSFSPCLLNDFNSTFVLSYLFPLSSPLLHSLILGFLPQYHKTIEAVYSVENSVETLLDLLQRYREKAGDKVAERGGSIFTKACFLLALLLQDKHRAVVCTTYNIQPLTIQQKKKNVLTLNTITIRIINCNYWKSLYFCRRLWRYPKLWIGYAVFIASLLANTRWMLKELLLNRRWTHQWTGASLFKQHHGNPALLQSMYTVYWIYSDIILCVYTGN